MQNLICDNRIMINDETAAQIDACSTDELQELLDMIREKNPSYLNLEMQTIFPNKMQSIYLAFISQHSFSAKIIYLKYTQKNYLNMSALEKTLAAIELSSKVIIETVYNVDGSPEQLKTIIESNFKNNVVSINLLTCDFKNFKLTDIQQLITVCKTKFGVSVKIADASNNIFKNLFVDIDYQQQQLLALDYLQLLYGTCVYYLPGEIINFIPFNVITHPDAFYDLVLNFMNSNRDESFTIRLLTECENFKLIPSSKWCQLFLEFYGKKSIEFEPDSIDITNICKLIKDRKIPFSLTKFLLSNYTFNNTEDKIKVLQAIYNSGQRIELPVNFILDFEEAVKISSLLKIPGIAGAYFTNNVNILNKDQKLRLLNICKNLNESISLINSGLPKEDILNYYQANVNLRDLAQTLLNVGLDKADVLKEIEELLKYPREGNYYLPLTVLGLNHDEIIGFFNRNPDRGFTLDEWVRSNTDESFTYEQRKELLLLRLSNSNNSYTYEHLLSAYRISTIDLPEILSKVTNHEVSVNVDLLLTMDWNDIYKYILKRLEINPDQSYLIKELATNKKHPELHKYLNSYSENDNPISIADAYKLLKDKMSIMTDTFCEIIQCSETVKNNFEKIYGKILNVPHTLENYSICGRKYEWLTVLKSQMLVELDFDRIAYSFSQSTFITVLEEIITLPSHYFRGRVTRDILVILKDYQKLIDFCELTKSSNSRVKIPALVITANSQKYKEYSSLLKMIGSDYKDNKNLKILLNGFVSIFKNNSLSDAIKFELAIKVLSYDIQFKAVANIQELHELHIGLRAELIFNQMYLTQIKDTSHFGLLAYDIEGNLIDLHDMKTDLRLTPLNKMLEIWCKRAVGRQTINIANVKNEILSILIKSKIFPCGLKSQTQAFAMLQGIFATDNIGILHATDFPKQSWLAAYSLVLKSCFDINPIEQYDVERTLAECRDPFSIIAYYARLKTGGKSSEPYITMLRQYVKLISSTNASKFYKYRYDNEMQPQLKAVFGENLESLAKWKNGFSLNFDDFYSQVKDKHIESKKQNLNVTDFLRRRIYDFKHLPEDSFAFIHKFLDPKCKNTQAIYVAAEQELQLCEVNPTDAKSKIAALKIQLVLMDYCSKQYTLGWYDKLKTIKSIDNQLVDIFPYPRQFCNDIDYLEGILIEEEQKNYKSINYKPQITTGWKIIDTDNFWDMLLIGTDVDGSCQNINGSPDLNRCLIGGYVLSGHIRQIAIKNMTGEIVARAVFRLMQDSITKDPVLYLEDIYPAHIDKSYSNAIQAFATLRAWQLGWSLVSGYNDFTLLYANPVAVVAVKVAEYVDAIGTPQTASYEINESGIILNTPVVKLNWQQQLQDNGLLMGRANYGPRPLGSIAEFVKMYDNYRKNTDPKTNPEKFLRKINLQLTNG